VVGVFKILGVVGDEFGKVVVVDLAGEGVFGCDEDVFEEARLGGGDVGEPAGVIIGQQA